METGLSWWVRSGARVGVWIGRKGKSRVHTLKEEKKRITKRARITGFIFWTMVIAVAFAVVAVVVHAVETPTTDPNPAEMAGIFAPIVALCTAFMALSQAANGRSLRIRPKPGIYIGGGSVICAYLWIVDESGNHLFDPMLPLILFVFLAISALAALAISLPVQQDNTQSVDQPSQEDNDDQ